MVRAKRTVHYGTENGTRTLGGGRELPDDHPLVKAHPHWFEPVPGGLSPAPSKARPKATRPRRAPSKAATKKAD